MTLQELLDELAQNILRDRSDLSSGPTDDLWSDATLVGYINEAQQKLARQGLVIRDATTPEVTQVTLAAGVSSYTLHPSVIGVISAQFAGDTGDLARAGHSAFSSIQSPDPLFFDSSQISTLTPGKPLAFGTDEEVDVVTGASGVVNMRVYPAPTIDYNGSIIQLRVVRKPINKLVSTALTVIPEVPEDYHLGLLDWAAYRALRNVDSDADAIAAADRYKAEFLEMVAQARADISRKTFTPLQWGFGRSGWSWVS